MSDSNRRSVRPEFKPVPLHISPGLDGILASKCLWATDSAFLNDWREINYDCAHRKSPGVLAENPHLMARSVY